MAGPVGAQSDAGQIYKISVILQVLYLVVVAVSGVMILSSIHPVFLQHKIKAPEAMLAM